MKSYIFGHSLIDHRPPALPTTPDETTVPHWMALLAEEENLNYSVTGQYGFMWLHAANLPPAPQWGYAAADAAWTDEQGISFAEVNFNNILMTVGNFIQYRGPDETYEVNGAMDTTPVAETLTVIDWLQQQEPNAEIFIYENWPDMAPYVAGNFPPTEQQFATYNADVLTTSHDWWLEYHDLVMAARPDANVRMIPVAPIISMLLTNGPLQDIPITELYEDDAPHGRPTIYFLAALITYAASYERQPPASFNIPESVHSLVAENYEDVISVIWSELQGFEDGNDNNRVF